VPAAGSSSVSATGSSASRTATNAPSQASPVYAGSSYAQPLPVPAVQTTAPVATPQTPARVGGAVSGGAAAAASYSYSPSAPAENDGLTPVTIGLIAGACGLAAISGLVLYAFERRGNLRKNVE
jgi:hypothetical protein